jgi:hypothetical protein
MLAEQRPFVSCTLRAQRQSPCMVCASQCGVQIWRLRIFLRHWRRYVEGLSVMHRGVQGIYACSSVRCLLHCPACLPPHTEWPMIQEVAVTVYLPRSACCQELTVMLWLGGEQSCTWSHLTRSSLVLSKGAWIRAASFGQPAGAEVTCQMQGRPELGGSMHAWLGFGVSGMPYLHASVYDWVIKPL